MNMKQKTADRIVYLLLIIGTAVCCAYQEWLAALILLVVFLGILAALWVRFIAGVLSDEADERAEEIAEERYREMVESTEYHVEYRQYVGLGKGYK